MSNFGILHSFNNIREQDLKFQKNVYIRPQITNKCIFYPVSIDVGALYLRPKTHLARIIVVLVHPKRRTVCQPNEYPFGIQPVSKTIRMNIICPWTIEK